MILETMMDRLKVIHTTCESAIADWDTGNLDAVREMLEVILSESNLFPQTPFTGELPPEVTDFLAGLP